MDGESKVLVCTDIASRGIDCSQVRCDYAPPSTPLSIIFCRSIMLYHLTSPTLCRTTSTESGGLVGWVVWLAGAGQPPLCLTGETSF